MLSPEIRAFVDNPDEIIFTISVTATLKDWLEIEKDIRPPNCHASHRLISAIQNVTGQAKTIFYERDKEGKLV